MLNSFKTSETTSNKAESNMNLGLSKFISCSLLGDGVASAWFTHFVRCMVCIDHVKQKACVKCGVREKLGRLKCREIRYVTKMRGNV